MHTWHHLSDIKYELLFERKRILELLDIANKKLPRFDSMIRIKYQGMSKLNAYHKIIIFIS